MSKKAKEKRQPTAKEIYSIHPVIPKVDHYALSNGRLFKIIDTKRLEFLQSIQTPL